MSRIVIISKTAEFRLEKLFEYLISTWTLKSKDKFIKKLDKSMGVIKNHPESFPESRKEKGLRKCVITKQTTLFYRFDSEKIYVITIFDTRQNLNILWQDIN